MEDETLRYVPGGQPVFAMQSRIVQEDARKTYDPSEEDVICGRFTHMAHCACEVNCRQAIPEIQLIEVQNGIFMGPY